MEFHENVKAFRREILKYKQKHLANELGISQSCLSNYENGIRSYPQNILEKIGELAGIPFPEFISLMYPHKTRKRQTIQNQLMMVKEAQKHIVAGFVESHLSLFEADADLRDFILLLSKLTPHKRSELLTNWKKLLVKEIQKK